MTQATRACLACSSDISERHLNARYCDQRCKYRYQRSLNEPPRLGRLCAWCEADISTKRPHALYCSRSCKSKAAERRLRKGTALGRARNQARYAKERKRRKAHARQQYWKNRDRYVARSRAWRLANPERRQVQSENRRAKKYGNPGYVVVTASEWEKIRNRFRGCCAYCGQHPETICMDHVVPLSRGGRHAPSNIVPACADCNGSKGAMFIAEWRLRLK